MDDTCFTVVHDFSSALSKRSESEVKDATGELRDQSNLCAFSQPNYRCDSRKVEDVQSSLTNLQAEL